MNFSTFEMHQKSVVMNFPVLSIIIDDEQHARESLRLLLQMEAPDVKVLASAENARVGLELIMDHQPDLVFLDVQMPGHDGFWLADKMKKLNHQSCIVFVTAFNNFAIEAFKYAAFDFLTKPVSPQLLRQVIERFKNERNRLSQHQKLEDLHYFINHSKLKFNTHDGFVMVKAEDIVFCEADRNYSEISMVSGEKYLITYPLLNLEKELEQFSFIRISRSHLININYLDRFFRKTRKVILTNSTEQISFKASASGARKLMELQNR